MLRIAALLVLLFQPASAYAATVAREGDEIVYRSDPGERDRVYFQGDVDDEEFDSLGAPIRMGPGCRPTGFEHRIRCDGKGATAVRIIAGDADDSIAFKASHPVIADLGPGDDELRGSYAALTISAGEGDDYVGIGLATGMVDLGPGSDRFVAEVPLTAAFETSGPPLRVNGGDGDDRLELLGRGPDMTLSGGRGNDRLIAEGGQGDQRVQLGCGSGADVVVYSRVDRPGEGCAASLTRLAKGPVPRVFRVGALTARAQGSIIVGRRARMFLRPRETVARATFDAPRGPLRVRLRVTGAGRRHPRLPVFVTVRTRTGSDRGEVQFRSRLG